MSQTPHYDPDEEGVERPSSENDNRGLPIWVIVVAALLCAVGFFGFRAWRSQYHSYEGIGGYDPGWVDFTTYMETLLPALGS